MNLYNGEVKKRFIEFFCADKPGNTAAQSTMNAVEPAENEFGKDVAQMTYPEAMAAVSKMDLNSLGTVYGKRVVIREYLAWCKDNHIFEQVEDGFLQALSPDIDISPAISRMIFRDDEDLYSSMRKVCDMDDGHFEPVILAFAWLGISKSDALRLRDQDVDLDNRKIYGRDGDIIVSGFSDVIYNILHDFEKTRVGFRSNRTAVYQVVKDYSHDSFIKRFASPDSKKIGRPLTQANIDSGINKMNQRYTDKGYPPRFTYSNVWKSGRFYALWELENSGVDVFNFENKENVKQLFGPMNYRGILWFYKAYKKAFNL